MRQGVTLGQGRVLMVGLDAMKASPKRIVVAEIEDVAAVGDLSRLLERNT
jgi:hypothetical protein